MTNNYRENNQIMNDYPENHKKKYILLYDKKNK